MDISAHVGQKIREYRLIKGLSQEDLATKLQVTPNTVSRWETTTYKPRLKDLDQLANFFSVSIGDFFPKSELDNEPLNALLRAADGLPSQDLETLKTFAELKKAEYRLKKGK